MKSKAKLLTILSLSLLVSILFVTNCSESNLTKSQISERNAIPATEIQFIKWNSEVTANLQTLDKIVVSEQVFTQAGGELSTVDMFGCKLIVPANAFNEDQRVIQAHITSENDNIAGIEFLPSQQFTKNVTIVLPFSAIKIEEGVDVSDIRAFWYDEAEELWVEIPTVNIDEENKIVKAEINHFTRFGWGF